MYKDVGLGSYYEKRKVKNMDKARKRLRICLLCIVCMAVLIGCLYYLYEKQGQESASKGTLISNVGMKMERLWR